MQILFVLSFVCVFRGFSCWLFFLRQLCFTNWKAPDYNQLCRGTPGSFVDYGWCIISIPLAKLLIEGVMSQAAHPPPPPGSNRCTCNKPASTACCSDSWFYYVRLCGLCALVAVSACSAHCDSGFPPGTANNRPWLLQGLQMSRKRPPRQHLRSCQLSQSFGWHRKGTPNLYLITF